MRLRLDQEVLSCSAMNLRQFFEQVFASGTTRKELSQRVGVSLTDINLVADGFTLPSTPTLRKYAAAFGWTPEELGTFVLTTPNAAPPRYLYGESDRPNPRAVQAGASTHVEADGRGDQHHRDRSDLADAPRESSRPPAPQAARPVLPVDSGRDGVDDAVAGPVEAEEET